VAAGMAHGCDNEMRLAIAAVSPPASATTHRSHCLAATAYRLAACAALGSRSDALLLSRAFGTPGANGGVSEQGNGQA
jgi:hypothetical protein